MVNVGKERRERRDRTQGGASARRRPMVTHALRDGQTEGCVFLVCRKGQLALANYTTVPLHTFLSGQVRTGREINGLYVVG